MDSAQIKTDRTGHVPLSVRSERGIEAIEVALLGALMAVVILAAIPLLGDSIYNIYEDVMTVINGAGVE